MVLQSPADAIGSSNVEVSSGDVFLEARDETAARVGRGSPFLDDVDLYERGASALPCLPGRFTGNT